MSDQPISDVRHPDSAASSDLSWQPASRNLTAELPALMSRMHDDGFDIFRVMFNPADWDEVPRKAMVGPRIVKLGLFHTQDRGVITVIDGSGRNRKRVGAQTS